MVPMPKIGVSTNPATKAPIIPTTIFRNRPCCASVRMMRLAIHPRMLLMIIHRIKFMVGSPRMTKGCRGSDRCAGPRSYYTIVRLTSTANTLDTGCLRNTCEHSAYTGLFLLWLSTSLHVCYNVGIMLQLFENAAVLTSKHPLGMANRLYTVVS